MAMRTSSEVRFSMLFDVKKGLQKVFAHHSEDNEVPKKKTTCCKVLFSYYLSTVPPPSEHSPKEAVHSKDIYVAMKQGIVDFQQVQKGCVTSFRSFLSSWASYVSMLSRTKNKSFTSPFCWWATQYSIGLLKSYHSVNNLVYDQFVRSSNI